MKSILLLLVLTLFSREIYSQPNKTNEMAEELLKLTCADSKSLQALQNRLGINKEAIISNYKLNKKDSILIDTLYQSISDAIKKEITPILLKNAFINAYSKTFNEQELANIINFYKSPSGAKWAENSNKVNLIVSDLLVDKESKVHNEIEKIKTDFFKSHNLAQQ